MDECSISFSTQSDDKPYTDEIERATAEDMKRLYKEADEDLVNVFNDLSNSESEDDSESGDVEDQETDEQTDRNMDVCSISFSTLCEDKPYTDEIERATAEDMKRLYKEADEDLVKVFHNLSYSESENDSESEDDENQGKTKPTDRFLSEGDESTSFSVANRSLAQRSYNKYENGQRKEDSYNDSDESSASKPSISKLSSHVYEKNVGTSEAGQSRKYSTSPNSHNGNMSDSDANDRSEYNSEAPIVSVISSVSAGSNQYGTIEESPCLKLQVQNLEEEKSNSEIKNSPLRANPILQQRSNTEFENELAKEDPCDGSEEIDKSKLHKLEDSDNQLEKNKLQEEIKYLTQRLSSLIEMNQFLENQLSELNTADYLSHEDHNRIVEEMKECFESNIFVYKENMDKLQSRLNLKLKEAEDLALENSELRKKNQQLEIEKDNWVNKISTEILAQKKCQLFLESGTIEEIKRLKLQVRHLEEEKSCIEKENSLLKESFFQRWARSLLLWQFQCLRRVSNIIGLPFF